MVSFLPVRSHPSPVFLQLLAFPFGGLIEPLLGEGEKLYLLLSPAMELDDLPELVVDDVGLFLA